MAALLSAATERMVAGDSQSTVDHGRKASKTGGKRSYGFEEAASLEHVKLAILKQMSKDRELLHKTQDKIGQYKSEVGALRASLATASAMFLEGKEKEKAVVTMKDKDGKDVSKTIVIKPLGTREAVAETKRIIKRRLTKLQQEFEVVEVKLNRQKAANAKWKHQINTMRREASVFDGLFDQMCDELMRLKSNTEGVTTRIAQTYAARDASRAEAQAVLDSMQRERAAAQEEFDLQTQALNDADAVTDRKSDVAAGALTLEQEELLKQTIVDTAWRIQEHKARLSKSKAKAAAFEEAIEQVKDATAYESLDELMAQMTACEEEKFDKARAVSRLITDVEALEKDIEVLRNEYRDKQTTNAEQIQASTAEVAELQLQANSAKDALQAEESALALARDEIASVMPMVSDLFYAAGCHTVFDKAFVPGSSIRQRSFIVARTTGSASDSRNRRDTAASQFLATLPTIEHDDDVDDDSPTSSPTPEARNETKSAQAEGVASGARRAAAASFGRSEGKAALEGPGKPRAAGDARDEAPESPSALRRPSRGSRGSESMGRMMYAGDSSPEQTPSSRRSLAMRMFSRIPAFRHVIDEGVNQYTLNTFMSVLDQKTAELVQFFVYLLHKGEVSVAVPLDTPTIASTSPAARAASIMGKAKQMTAHTIVGPAAPSGVVARSLTSSALLASLLSTDMASSAMSPQDLEDSDRPLSLSEIRAQAGASLQTAEFSAFRKASEEAASELERHTKKARSRSTARSKLAMDT